MHLHYSEKPHPSQLYAFNQESVQKESTVGKGIPRQLHCFLNRKVRKKKAESLEQQAMIIHRCVLIQLNDLQRTLRNQTPSQKH